MSVFRFPRLVWMGIIILIVSLAIALQNLLFGVLVKLGLSSTSQTFWEPGLVA